MWPAKDYYLDNAHVIIIAAVKHKNLVVPMAKGNSSQN
jgi:hypothetical protein